MNLRQKVALVLAVVVLFMSGIAFVDGNFESAALGVFLSVSSVVTNFRIWSNQSRFGGVEKTDATYDRLEASAMDAVVYSALEFVYTVLLEVGIRGPVLAR